MGEIYTEFPVSEFEHSWDRRKERIIVPFGVDALDSGMYKGDGRELLT